MLHHFPTSEEVDGYWLYVYAKNEATAAEIEDDFAPLIADIASRILQQEIDVVVVLPKVLQQLKSPTMQ